MRWVATVFLAVSVLAGCSDSEAEDRTETVARDSGTRATTFAIPVGNGPCCIAAVGDRLWVLNRRDETLQSIDPANRQVSAPIAVGARQMVGVRGRLFLADTHTGELSVFDPQNHRQVPIRGFGGRGAVGSRGSELWVGSSDSGELVRVSADTGTIVEQITVPGVASYDSMIFTHDGLLWTTTWDGELLRVDVDRRRVVSRHMPFAEPKDYVGLAAGADRVFAVSGGSNELVTFDASTAAVVHRRSIRLEGGDGFPVFPPQPDGTLLLARGPSAIDVLSPRTGHPVSTYDVPGEADPADGDQFFGGAAFGFGTLWVGRWSDYDQTGSVVRLAHPLPTS